MPNVATIEFIPGTGMIVTEDIWANIDVSLHGHSPELGTTLQTFVRALTPIRTGALLQDIASFPNTVAMGVGGGESTLVLVTAEDVAQEAYWHRYYAPYQEGGELGLPTYTNAPHEMFFLTATTDGLDEVMFWAMDYIDEALRLSAVGGGVAYPVPYGLGLIRP